MGLVQTASLSLTGFAGFANFTGLATLRIFGAGGKSAEGGFVQGWKTSRFGVLITR